MMEFDNLNGFLVEKGEKIFDTSLRVMRYGDGIFETLKVVEGKVLFWDDHYERLKAGIEKLKLDDSNYNKEFWEQEIERVVVKNYYKNARIRLIVFRNSPGLYTPMSNRIGFLIEGMRYDKPDYTYTEKDYTLGVYHEEQKAINGLSNLKTINALLFVLAGINKKEQEKDDLIILNSNNKICETISSNIFWIKNGEVFTPNLESGPINGVVRKQVLNILENKKIKFQEGEFDLKELDSAEEIFVTNSSSGVQVVTDFNGKKLTSNISKSIQSSLAGYTK